MSYREQLPVHYSFHERDRPRGGFRPDQWQYDAIKAMAPYITDAELAAILAITVKVLHQHFKKEIELARAQANAIVGGLAFRQIVAGNSDMIKFWLSRKMKWVEVRNQTTTVEEDAVLAQRTTEAIEAELRELQERMEAAARATVGE